MLLNSSFFVVLIFCLNSDYVVGVVVYIIRLIFDGFVYYWNIIVIKNFFKIEFYFVDIMNSGLYFL